MPETFDPIPWDALNDGHMQLSEKVAMHLRELIVSGQIKQGTFLRIENIASTLGISPTPVREGLLLLRSESLVRMIPRRGFMVNSFTKQDVFDLFWAQATIGGELAARAATVMSDAEIEQLMQLHANYEKAIKGGDERLTGRTGHEFHRAINLAAQSHRLANLLGSLTRQLPNRFYANIEGNLTTAVEFHTIILGAIKVRDPDAARSLMFRHINEAGQRLVEMLDRRGLWGMENSSPTIPSKRPKGQKAAADKPSRKR